MTINNKTVEDGACQRTIIRSIGNDIVKVHGVIRLNRIKNQCLKGNLGVIGIAREMRKNGRRWYGYVQRRNNDKIVIRS